jgi:hypothetical protein
VSKFHEVEPDTNKSNALGDMGFPSNYIPVALQLANNSMDQAAELILRMKSRAAELEAAAAAGGGSATGSSVSRLGLGMGMGGAAGAAGQGGVPSISYNAMGADINANGSSGGSERIPRSNSDPSLAPSEDSAAYSISMRRPSGTSSSSSTVEFPSDTSDGLDSDVDASTCPVCSSDDVLKRDQLIPCNGCERNFHAACLGFRRIPFTMKTAKEKTNREKYILKHYGLWMCQDCVVELESRVSTPNRADGGGGGRPLTPGGGRAGNGSGNGSGDGSARSPMPGGGGSGGVTSPNGSRVSPMPAQAQSKHDQVRACCYFNSQLELIRRQHCFELCSVLLAAETLNIEEDHASTVANVTRHSS